MYQLIDPNLFRPEQSDDTVHRKMFHGQTSGIIDLNNQRFKWAEPLYQQMRDNFWRPMKFDLTEDTKDYNNLTDAERRAYKGQLSYLTFLDSVQVNNLPFLQRHLTAPELSICVAEQASQEAMHAQSYAYIIETILPPHERDLTYHYWKENLILKERCKNIAELYTRAMTNPSEENLTLSFFADYLLEAVFFYTGFMFFYNLLSRQLMCNTADIIKLINRDEYLHLKLFQKFCFERFQMTPNVVPEALEISKRLIEQEILWNCDILGDEILGMPQESIPQYLHFLGNQRLKTIGLEEIFPKAKNPFKHLDGLTELGEFDNTASTKADFFETNVTSYQFSTVVEGWDEI